MMRLTQNENARLQVLPEGAGKGNCVMNAGRQGEVWERFRKGSIGCGIICCLASAFSICCDQMVCSDLSG